MHWSFSKLFEITVDHPYFNDSEKDAWNFIPTRDTERSLRALRLRHHTKNNTIGVYFEEDTISQGLICPIEDSETFSFLLVPNDPIFPTITEFNRSKRPFCLLRNEDENVSEGSMTRRLHTSLALGDDDLKILQSGFIQETFNVVDSNIHTIRIVHEDGSLLDESKLATDSGVIAYAHSLDTDTRGLVSLFFDGALKQVYYVDQETAARRPAARVEITARPGLRPQNGFLDSNGAPDHKNFVVRFQLRETFWRFLVIPRSDSNLDDTNLVIEDSVLINGSPRYSFQGSPKTSLNNGEEAVIFHSQSTIPLSRTPASGIALKKSVSPSGYSTLFDSLPNPDPLSMSVSSGPNSPLYSDIYVYV